ncbi:hypothetical protein MUA02_13825 [Enterobacteriaceae bacterium H20N1]|uniref:Uncharacterized protein n=1 Tax=Dryocola boscaweniae TaxID=2925397 RepID=A0A9X3ABW6_9ENTR|nr:hypothetical protein [Dryocola boscaweniae]MCT4702934.1 hypothetical protein [Dryocola boscaweniae]MCT4713701.1 hypothetical protein [Dryocola boscaweniae]MCT4720102.1 hypothetical protein [Dryocola boscaweniae]
MITLLHPVDIPLPIKRLIPVLRLRQKRASQKSKRLTPRVKTVRQNEGKRLSGLLEWIFNRTLSLFAENNAG